MSASDELARIAGQRFSGMTVRAVGTWSAGSWGQHFTFTDNVDADPQVVCQSNGPDFAPLDVYRFDDVLKVGPSDVYVRRFETDVDPKRVASRLLSVSRPRKPVRLPLGLLPSPWPLLAGGPTARAAAHLAKFGEEGVERFAVQLAELTGDGRLSDSEVYWRGWLVTQGQETFEARKDEEPPWDDSWDPEIGEAVTMFVEGVREEVAAATSEPADAVPMPPTPPQGWWQHNLDQLARRVGFRGDPLQDAWYRAGVSGFAYSALTIFRDGTQYTEVVSYFVGHPGQDPHLLLREHITTRQADHGEVLQTRLTALHTDLQPRWTPVFSSRLGRGPTHPAIAERLFFTAS